MRRGVEKMMIAFPELRPVWAQQLAEQREWNPDEEHEARLYLALDEVFVPHLLKPAIAQGDSATAKRAVRYLECLWESELIELRSAGYLSGVESVAFDLSAEERQWLRMASADCQTFWSTVDDRLHG